MRFTLLLVAVFSLVGISLSHGQDADKVGNVPAASSKFANLPGLPACATLSVQRGDPSKGPAVVLLKTKAGCVIPWHWHTADEQLMMVSGSAKVAMKDGASFNFRPGDFAFCRQSIPISSLAALPARFLFCRTEHLTFTTWMQQERKSPLTMHSKHQLTRRKRK